MANQWRFVMQGSGKYCQGAPCGEADCVRCHARGLAEKLAARGHDVRGATLSVWFDGPGGEPRAEHFCEPAEAEPAGPPPAERVEPVALETPGAEERERQASADERQSDAWRRPSRR